MSSSNWDNAIESFRKNSDEHTRFLLFNNHVNSNRVYIPDWIAFRFKCPGMATDIPAKTVIKLMRMKLFGHYNEVTSYGVKEHFLK